MKRLISSTALTILVLGLVGCTGGEVTVSQGDDRPPLDLSGPVRFERPPRAPTAPVDYAIVEQKPMLEGGLDGLAQTIHYPETAQTAGLEGTVRVSFIVNTAGVVERASVVQALGGECDAEALRAVQVARFTPGRDQGNVVNVKTCLAIQYQLPDATIRAHFCAS